MKQKRVCIYPKDIQRITGRSERFGRKLLNDIKHYYDKQPHQFVTVNEFAIYTGIDLDLVNQHILD